MNTRLFILALLAITAPASLVTAQAPRARHVFIVSFDGGSPAVMKQSEMPFTMERAAAGAATWNAQTVYPSVTLVSHTSMLTGVGPDKHGVNWNDWTPEKGVVNVPTVFAVAKARLRSTALFAAKDKLNHLNQPDAIDAFAIIDERASIIAKVAAAFIEQRKPSLCFIHFADSDDAGHLHGWGSPQQMRALADQDAALRVICDAIEAAGIAERSVVILTADHGGHDKEHGSNSPEDMTVPWIAWGAGVKSGYTIESAVTTYDTAATALWLLGVDVPENWDGKPVTAAFQEISAER